MSSTKLDYRFRASLLQRGVRDAIRGTPIDNPTFTGSTFDRLKGMEQVLDGCKGASVLDIGTCDGLVAYEFARCGASQIHGFDCNYADIAFAMRLFRCVPVESAFFRADISLGAERFLEDYAEILNDSYDIVLFLGVYHHLEGQMEPGQLDVFLDCLLVKTKGIFVIRTNVVEKCEAQIRSRGFKLIGGRDGDNVGKLQIYQRDDASNASA